MKKIKFIYITTLALLLSFTPVMAQDLSSPTVVSEIKELKLEDAILQAQKRSRELKMQQRQIDLAKVESEDAYYNYNNSWDYNFDSASVNYSLKKVNEEYEIKAESIVKEQIAYDIENQFDSILELEEKYALVQTRLQVQEQKTRQAITKWQLGLASESAVKVEKISLEVQKKELDGLIQAIDAGYRKLNDTIGGKENRYNLIKENIYTPLEMKRSLEGHISYSIGSDPTLWKQEESAKLQEGLIITNTPNGAPTYAEYQKRKITYEQGMSSVSQSKDNREQILKDRYEKILQLEVQHEKALLDLEDAHRKYDVVKKQYELGMVTRLTLEETQLGFMQIQTQISSIVRQHNQLKTLFEKSYLAPMGM